MPVYDDEKQKNSTLPSNDDLARITGIDPAEAERKALQERDDDFGAQFGLDKNEEAEMDRNARSSPKKKDTELDEDKLRNAEDDSTAQPKGTDDKNAKKDATSLGLMDKDGNYTGGATDDSRKSLKKVLTEGNTLKRALLGGGVFAGGTGLLMSFFIFIAPLKMIHIVNNLQQHFFANAEQATQKEADRLFTSYLVRHVMPGMGGDGACKSTATITKNCVHVAKGDGPVDKLMNGWRDARLENRLSKNYGMEFMRKSDGSFWMKSNVFKGDGVNITDISTGKVTNLTDSDGFKNYGSGTRQRGATYKAFMADFRRSMDGETKWKQIMYKFKVGALLREKYGFRRCIFFCSTRDAFDKAWTTQAVNPLKLSLAALTNKVFLPEDEVLNVAFECVLDEKCKPTETRTTSSDCTPGVDCALGGEPRSEPESNAQRKFRELASRLDPEGVADLMKTVDNIKLNGYAQTLFEKFFGEVGGKVASKITTKAIPIIGWIDFASRAVIISKTLPDAWVAMSYMVTSVADVNAFTTWRVMADEQKLGNTNGAVIGSMISRLGSSTTTDQGGVAAEAHPLYKALMDGGYGGKNPSSSTYKCDNGKPVPFGDAVCPEESLTFSNSVFEAINAFFKGPGLVLYGIAEIWAKTVGQLLDLVSWIVGKGVEAVNALCDSSVPEAVKIAAGVATYCKARTTAMKYGKEFMQYVISYIFKVPCTITSAGGRWFGCMAGGANVLGKMTALMVTGGMYLSADQSDRLRGMENDQINNEYAQLPLYQRIFSTANSRSLISRLALAMPTNLSASFLSNSFSTLANPFSMVLGGFSTALSGEAASAQIPSKYVDYWGDGGDIGTPDDDPSYDRSPEDVWANPDPKNEHGTNLKCSDGSFTLKWNNDAIPKSIKSPVKLPYYTYVNPCLRIQAAVGAAGGLFTSDVLTDDDKTAVGFSTDAPTSANNPALYKDSTSLTCPTGTRDLGVADGYYKEALVPIRLCAITGFNSSSEESSPVSSNYVTGANGDVIVNASGAGLFLKLYQDAKLTAPNKTLSAVSSFRTMSHQTSLCNTNPGCRNGSDYSTVAKPGTSNHQMGLAIDISFTTANDTRSNCVMSGTVCQLPGDPLWRWLVTQNHASQAGLKQYDNEFWHFSPNGN